MKLNQAMNSQTPSRSRNESAVDRVADALRNGLMTRRFAPGQRLIEADLTDEFGVSRGTLRQAFSRLESDGLIEIVPNRGALVRQLSSRDINELFQIRSELEGLASRLAAIAMTDPDTRSRFEAAIAPIWDEAPRTDPGRYLEENSRFHQAILTAADNQQLASICGQFHLHMIMGQAGRALSGDAMSRSVLEHRELATAILANDPASADSMMRNHLLRALQLSQKQARDPVNL
jgi:DNA-binding GntR family transcriptional regulator